MKRVKINNYIYMQWRLKVFQRLSNTPSKQKVPNIDILQVYLGNKQADQAFFISKSMTWVVVLKFQGASVSPGSLVKIQPARPYTQNFDALGLGWGLNICISNKFPKVILMLPDQRPKFENYWLDGTFHLVRETHKYRRYWN